MSLKLSTQEFDICIDNLWLTLKIKLPDMLDDLIPAQYLLWVPKKHQ